MSNEADRRDKRESRGVALLLLALLLILAVGAVLMLPALGGLIDTHFSPGLGLKDAALISFGVSVVIMIVFALAAGDGLLGEIQYMLGGFFSFFLIVWLMLAWIF